VPRNLHARLARLERPYGPSREAQIDHVMDAIERLSVEAPDDLAAVLRALGLSPTTPKEIR